MTTHDHHTDYDSARTDVDASTAQRPADRQDYPTGQGAAPEYDPNLGYADQSAGRDARPTSEPPLGEAGARPSDERLARPSDDRLDHVSDDRSNGPTGDQFSEQGAVTNPVGVQGVSSKTAEAGAERGTSPEMGEDLFADDEMVGLRARWDSVQASFVDDPKDCVQKADGLVSDLVEQLTSSFAHARSRLEEQWARGEDASTEDLRIALKRYREFFDRLLAV